MLVARYADHLPLYRQAQIMARQGVILERSTLSFWMGYAAAEVAPVVARLREMMLASTRTFADETLVPGLDPGRGRKNSLFAGSDEGGANWACLASPVETCKMNNVNPQLYFTDLQTRLVNGWPQNRIDELMPWHWATKGPVETSLSPQGP